MLRGLDPVSRQHLRWEYGKTLTSQFIALGVFANIANIMLSPRHNTIVEDLVEGNRPIKRAFDVHIGKDSANRDTYLMTPFYRVVHDITNMMESVGDFRYGYGKGADSMWNFISNKIHPMITSAIELPTGRNIRGPQKWQPYITPGATGGKYWREVGQKAIQNTFIPTYVPDISPFNAKQDPYGSPLGKVVKSAEPWFSFYEGHDRAGGQFVEKAVEQRQTFDAAKRDKMNALDKDIREAVTTGMNESRGAGKAALDKAISIAISAGIEPKVIKQRLLQVAIPSKWMKPRLIDYINPSIPVSERLNKMREYKTAIEAYKEQII
jgi:hypothetical protein